METPRNQPPTTTKKTKNEVAHEILTCVCCGPHSNPWKPTNKTHEEPMEPTSSSSNNNNNNKKKKLHVTCVVFYFRTRYDFGVMMAAWKKKLKKKKVHVCTTYTSRFTACLVVVLHCCTYTHLHIYHCLHGKKNMGKKEGTEKPEKNNLEKK